MHISSIVAGLALRAMIAAAAVPWKWPVAARSACRTAAQATADKPLLCQTKVISWNILRIKCRLYYHLGSLREGCGVGLDLERLEGREGGAGGGEMGGCPHDDGINVYTFCSLWLALYAMYSGRISFAQNEMLMDLHDMNWFPTDSIDTLPRLGAPLPRPLQTNAWLHQSSSQFLLSSCAPWNVNRFFSHWRLGIIVARPPTTRSEQHTQTLRPIHLQFRMALRQNPQFVC